MSLARLSLLTTLAMLAFAGNSVLCRMALRDTAIDPASFTSLRLVSGAAVLWLLLRCRSQPVVASGNWGSAIALFVYAAAFSWAYIQLDAASGALLLFAAVQVSMLGIGLLRGERLGVLQTGGFLLALVGLAVLLLPGASAPPAIPALSMLSAGVAWGLDSHRPAGGHGRQLCPRGPGDSAADAAHTAKADARHQRSAPRAGIRRRYLRAGLRHLVRRAPRFARQCRSQRAAQRAGDHRRWRLAAAW